MRRNLIQDNKETVLVYVTGDRIGDGILKFPVIRAFKESNPRTKLIWTTGINPSVFLGSLSELGTGLLDEIHEKSGIGSLPRKKRVKWDHKIDTVICTEASLSSTFFLKRIRANTFISPAARFMFSSLRPQENYGEQSVYEKFLTLMNLVSQKPLTPNVDIPIPRDFSDYARNRLKGPGIFVGLNPGASSSEKRWPIKFFIDIAKLLAAREIVPTFFLGPMEGNLKSDIEHQIPSAIFPENEFGSQKNKSPLLTIALAQKLAFSLVNDSGGGHLIAAGGNTTITLFNNRRGMKFRSPFCKQIALNAADFKVNKVQAIPYKPVLKAVERILENSSIA